MGISSNRTQGLAAAQRNADWFGRPYMIFTDTSGNVRVERYQESVVKRLGDLVEIVHPKQETAE